MLLVCRKDRIIRKSLQHFETLVFFFVVFHLGIIFTILGVGLLLTKFCMWQSTPAGEGCCTSRGSRANSHQHTWNRKCEYLFLDCVDFMISTFMQFVQFFRRQISDGTCGWCSYLTFYSMGLPEQERLQLALLSVISCSGESLIKNSSQSIKFAILWLQPWTQFISWEEKILLFLIRS